MSDQDSADEFFLEFNGKQFNSMEPETCIVLFIANVEFAATSSKKLQQTLLFPPSGQLELPTCPVCLERLDESVSGVLTILCNHSFHCQCLSKWKGDNSCPVCRFCQQPEGQSPVCSVCHTTESLWICLLCGNIGCGRYVKEHARLHFKETMHAYALELQTARVWDYAGDGYVHRLVQNKSDGQLVEVPEPSPTAPSADNLSKVESISLEYTYLLEAQKKYFDEQLKRIEVGKARKIVQLDEEYASLVEIKEQVEGKIQQNEEEKKKKDKRMVALEKQLKQQTQEINFLKEINDALKLNQIEWKEKVEQTEKKLIDETKDKRIQELEDQIRDLMFFIEAKQKIEGDSELQQGQLQVIVPPASATAKKKHRKKSDPIPCVGKTRRMLSEWRLPLLPHPQGRPDYRRTCTIAGFQNFCRTQHSARHPDLHSDSVPL